MGLLALVAVVGVVSAFAFAADPATKPAGTEGVFVKVVGAKLVMTVKDKEATILTDDKTVVTLDGKDAKLADLKAGMTLVVTMTDAAAPTAAKVEAKTAVAAKVAA
jgi:hypothetical protein